MKEKYNLNRTENIVKIQCNTVFGRLSERNKGNILILDSEKLFTANMLRNRGFKDKQIFIPNPYAFGEINRKKKTNVFNSLLGEFICDTDKSFTAAWFDYCCSFGGNVDVAPKSDISRYFQFKLAKNNGTFAVTFCYRKNNQTKFLHEDYANCNTFITQTAYDNGYILIPQQHRIYNGFFFISYKVYKL